MFRIKLSLSTYLALVVTVWCQSDTCDRHLTGYNACINEKLSLLESKSGPSDTTETRPTQQISFMATASRDIKPIVGGTLIFDQVLTNKGGGYNKSTGIFTAPVSGSYFFVLTVSIPTPSPANGGDYVRIDIMKNGKLSGYLFIGTQGVWIKRSENTLLELSKGDKVNLNVRTTGSGFTRIPGGGYHSHFTGFLIN